MSGKASGFSPMIIQDPDHYDLRSVFRAALARAMDVGEDGGDSDDGGGDEGQGGGASGSGTENNDTSNGGDGGASGFSGNDDGRDDDIKDPRLKRVSEEAKARRLEAKAEKKRADDLAARLKEYEDKDKSELDKVTDDLAEARGSVEALSTENVELRLKVALFESGELDKFQDRADALRFLDTRDFTDEDGEVDSKKLSQSVKKLLESKPYLGREGSNNSSSQSSGNGASGSSHNGGKSSKAEDATALAKKFPALATRR